MHTSIIVSTGCYLPATIIPNSHFLDHSFYDENGVPLQKPNPEIIATLQKITGIQERRYVTDDLTTTDIAFDAAKAALAGIDKESLDYIIVAQNFGDVQSDNPRTDMVPTIASRVKQRLEIENPYCVAYDIPFGCPGWLQGMIMADYYIRSGDARKVLVIGAEILSRVSDPHDVDCMIFADGAGATVLAAAEGQDGILAHATRTDARRNAMMLRLGKSYNPDYGDDRLFIKMDGHDIYKYALRTVPLLVERALEKAGIGLGQVKKILMHQANAKMDDAILKRLFKHFGMGPIPDDILPMIIQWCGNSSVATIPTVLDLLMKGDLQGHHLHPGEIMVFVSIGAGMNINAMVYRLPFAQAAL